jgi:hypothetical protein
MLNVSFPDLVLSISLSLAAGACLYLILLNRYLLLLEDGGIKVPLTRAIMWLIGLGTAAYGYWAAGTPWMLLPIAILASVGFGELQRLLIRRRTRGAPPVETTNYGITWGKPDTTTDLAVLRYELSVPDWRGRDLRIVHVSDLHMDGNLPEAHYAAAMTRVHDAAPDLLIFTGDFVRRADDVAALPAVLSCARGRVATLVILGNHDYWADARRVADAVLASGVTLLSDRSLRLEIDGVPLLICGDEGPWSESGWQPPHVPPGELALLLTHTPDNIYRLSRLGYTAIFAGHYHAGQIRLPGLGSLVVPSRYGRRFDHGHFVVNGTHLFVTAGIGSAVPPRRIYCQPDILIVDVRGRNGERGDARSAHPDRC